MNLKYIRQLIKEHAAVVLVEEGYQPLVVRELRLSEEPQEVPISARWPKTAPVAQPARPDGRTGGDAVLERLNKEILALKEQIAQEESQAQVEGQNGN